MRIALFILILLVVTGIVAASGDRMGHLAARRKIRFGNMRPRNVSTLIAVTTEAIKEMETSLSRYCCNNCSVRSRISRRAALSLHLCISLIRIAGLFPSSTRMSCSEITPTTLE